MPVAKPLPIRLDWLVVSPRTTFPKASGWFRPTQRLWPEPDQGPWLLEFYWSSTDPEGPIECTGVTLRSTSDLRLGSHDMLTDASSGGHELTTGLVRSIPWASLIDHEKVKLAEAADQNWNQISKAIEGLTFEPEGSLHRATIEYYRTLAQRTARPSSASDKPNRGRPPVWAPQHWVDVAAVYKFHDRGRYSAPTRAVREWFEVPASTARKWVWRCRQLGLIPPARRSNR